MPEHEWFPVEAEDDPLGFQITYHNELGDEHVHLVETLGIDLTSSTVHSLCWTGCSGDWPGCKMNCPLFTGPISEWAAEQKKYETVPPYDPFNFMLNHTAEIDDLNYYVEKFETLDGTHWEIAVDVTDELLDYLDEETRDEE